MYSPTPTDQVDVTTSVGARYPEEAPIAAIVMSTNSDRRALRAVDSLLKQDLKAQIVVVNTGHGSLHEVLKPVIGDIKLVETTQRQFPGGTRNLGIRHSNAPVVAFMAADCAAEERWLQKRYSYHIKHAAVSSSVEPMPSGSGSVPLISRCAHLAVHRHRLAGSGREYPTRYGLSYARTLFSTHGLFDETVRVGEDTLLNTKLQADGHVFHAADIVTFHEYPSTIRAAVVDQFRRGRRRSRFAMQHNSGRLKVAVGELKKIVNRHILDMFRDQALRNRGFFVVVFSALLSLVSAVSSLFPSDADT